MNILVTIYLAGVGLFVSVFFTLWVLLRKRGSLESGDQFFLPAFLLAVAWPVSIVAFFAMLIVGLAEKEGGER